MGIVENAPLQSPLSFSTTNVVHRHVAMPGHGVRTLEEELHEDNPYSEYTSYIDNTVYSLSTAQPHSPTEIINVTSEGAYTASNPQPGSLVLPQPFFSPLEEASSRRKRSAMAITALVLLFLLLLIEGGGLAYYAAIVRPTDLRVQATAVAKNFLAFQAQQNAHATPTPVLITDSMTPQEVYAKATSGTPVIDDPLTKLGGNAWYEYGNAANGCTFHDGAYHMHTAKMTSYYYCLAADSLFDNLAFQTRVMITKGDDAGLMFRIGNGTDYLFVLDYRGGYSLLTFKNGQYVTLRQTVSSAILAGRNQSNLFAVVAYNDHFYLYINNQPVAQVLDTTATIGQIGFLGETSANSPIDIAFNNVKVWSLS